MKKEKRNFVEVLMLYKEKIACVVFAFVLLGISTWSIFLFLNIVRIQDQEQSKIIITTFSEQDKLLQLTDTQVGEQDKVLYTSFDANFKNLTIKRSFDVPITVDGETVQAQITQGTVLDCLTAAGVVLGEYDYTIPSFHTQIKDGDSIRVYRVQYVDNQYEESVPFETVYKKNSLTYRFKSKSYVIQAGSNGKNLVTYRERYVDGELELALVSKVEVVKKPVSQVVLSYANTAISPLSGPAGVSVSNGVPTGYSRVLENMSATGYYSAKGRGASGLGLYYGTVAVNPNVIPYGTKMYIASADGQFIYGWAIATDTGSALMEGVIDLDLFYETYKESSLNWRNTVNVYIY